MPPKRRSTTRTASNPQQQQSTLSFNGKSSRVTKTQQKPQQGKELDAQKKELLLDSAAQTTEIDHPSPSEPTTADKAISQQADVEARALSAASNTKAKPEDESTSVSKTEDVLGGRAQSSDVGAVGGLGGSGWVGDEEAQARKITDSQIKKFWREKESERLVPRVHQEDLSVREKVLREWDVSGEYGPCIGIARLKRWKRANVLGLKPPMEVLAVLLKEMEDNEDGAKVQRAYVDSLMSSRFVET